MKNIFFRILLVINVLPICSFMNDGNTTEGEESIIFAKDSDISCTDTFGKPLLVTGTIVNNCSVELSFLESKPIVSVTINKVTTGTVTHQQILNARGGHQYQIPVAGYQAGTYNIALTDEESGEVISGEFNIKQ